MERDEETGLALHGARYYAAWLGRWTAGDPIGLGDGVNRYAYAGNRPVGSNDTTGLAERKPIWADVGKPKTQAEYLAEQEGAAQGNLLAMPDDPVHDDHVTSQAIRTREWTDYLLNGGGLVTLINAQRASSAKVTLAYFSFLMLPAAIGGAAMTSSVAGRTFFASAAAYDVDQLQASVRGIATNEEASSGLHAAAAVAFEASGQSGEDASRNAGYVELAVGGAFLLGGLAVPSPGRWSKRLQRAGTAEWTDYLGAASVIQARQTAQRLADLDVVAARCGVTAGEAGPFAALRANAVIGDTLTPHHMPQAALGFTSRAEGGALVMPHAEHALTRTYSWKGVATARAEAGLSFRQVLARDIRDVRKIAGSAYDPGLRELLQYYRTNFPGLIAR